MSTRVDDDDDDDEESSLDWRGSMERMTLATGRVESSSSLSEEGILRERETNAGHFISHIDLSHLLVSTIPPIVLLLPLLLPSSMEFESELLGFVIAGENEWNGFWILLVFWRFYLYYRTLFCLSL